MIGERPRPFGEPLGFDSITSTLIFGEHDAVLVDATLTGGGGWGSRGLGGPAQHNLEASAAIQFFWLSGVG